MPWELYEGSSEWKASVLPKNTVTWTSLAALLARDLTVDSPPSSPYLVVDDSGVQRAQGQSSYIAFHRLRQPLNESTSSAPLFSSYLRTDFLERLLFVGRPEAVVHCPIFSSYRHSFF